MNTPGHNSTFEISRKFRERLIVIEGDRRNAAEDIRELGLEMRKAGLTPIQIDGIKVSVRRHFAKAEKLEKQQAALQFALSFE